MVPPRLCPYIIGPTHVCAQTRLCPDTIMPRHDCARLSPYMIAPRHVCSHTYLICAQAWLCPDTFVFRHISAQHELLWPDTIMSLVNNNIIIVSTRLIMCKFDWWKHKHAQLLLAERSKVWLFNYCSAITSCIPAGIFRYFIIARQGTKYVSGHKSTLFCLDMIVIIRL